MPNSASEALKKALYGVKGHVPPEQFGKFSELHAMVAVSDVDKVSHKENCTIFFNAVSRYYKTVLSLGGKFPTEQTTSLYYLLESIQAYENGSIHKEISDEEIVGDWTSDVIDHDDEENFERFREDSEMTDTEDM